mmetsp:Transcript_20371/g.37821  ORF Transcript_20371/g.37821 Transcript_20371/m.37821 type:complete len:160 (-) Transcript_20371:107-586(-)
MFKCNMTGGDCVEGGLIAIDPVSKVVVLEQADEFKFVFPSQLGKVEGDVSKCVKGDEALSLQVKSLEKREQASLESSEQSIASLNFSVSPEVQAIYDRIEFLYPTRWDGNAMVVLDQYIIEAPYKAENIVLIRDKEGTADGLSRLTKVLMGERKKLGIA